MLAFAVFVGAGVGGLARHGIGGWAQAAGQTGFPWATLLINVTGSLLLTFVYGVLDADSMPVWRAFLGVGVLGGFTTFSTFSLDAVRLAQDGHWERALAYAVSSVGLSLGGAVLGLRLADALTGALVRRG